MNLEDITILTAIDEQHIHELRLSVQTWVKFRPEMIRMPMVIMYDVDYFGSLALMPPQWNEIEELIVQLRGLGIEDVTYIPWTMWRTPPETQREKMLNSLVFGVKHIDTPWYLKLDTDTVATAPGNWVQDSWFEPDDKGNAPTFITSPWGYTKPANLLDIMDDWGDTIDGLKQYPRLNIPHAPESNKVCSPRIISWCMFGNTKWTQSMAALCDQKLPVPSQDTFLYYCAARRGEFYRRERMSRFGWSHIGRNTDRLIQQCQEILR